jgi:hypothetical protein
MLKLADIDVYELVDALGMERIALVNAAKEEGRRPTDAERVTICVLRALDADDYFNAVCKGDMFFSQLVGPTLGRVAILDARGRSPHVRSGRPPIVGPRGRGSLPRFPAAGKADTGAFLGRA